MIIKENVGKNNIWVDLNLFDSTLNLNEKAVLESIINLLQTEENERFFNPEAYIRWETIMGMPNSKLTYKYLEKIIEYDIPQREPRVKKAYCKITPTEQPHEVLIEIDLELETGEKLNDFLQITLGER